MGMTNCYRNDAHLNFQWVFCQGNHVPESQWMLWTMRQIFMIHNHQLTGVSTDYGGLWKERILQPGQILRLQDEFHDHVPSF